MQKYIQSMFISQLSNLINQQMKSEQVLPNSSRKQVGKTQFFKVINENISMLDLIDEPLPSSCIELRPYLEIEDQPSFQMIQYSSKEESLSIILKDEKDESQPFNEIPLKLEEETPHVKKEEEEQNQSIKKEENPKNTEKEDIAEAYTKSCELLTKCRLIEKYIIQNGPQPIFQYSIGFDSDQEKEEPMIDENQEKIKEKIYEEEPAVKFQEDSLQNQRPYIKKKKQRKSRPLSLNPILMLDARFDIHNPSINESDKKIFLIFREQAQKVNKVLFEYFKMKSSSEHVCKICGVEFQSGRKLGGHMSRKHPGKSIEYVLKKQVHRNKQIERKRRNYFKAAKIQQDQDSS